MSQIHGADPIAFVVSMNLHRRQLNASQKAMVALEIEKIEAAVAKERQGSRTDIKARMPESYKGQARDKTAATVGVSADI